MKISVIMPSYLGHYDGSASDRERKFERAINSFITQSYENKELIIVSDGCEITNNIVKKKFNRENIKLISIPKQPMFSGNVRNEGLRHSSGDVITFLDSDDYYGNNLHIECIYNAFLIPTVNWIYFDDIMRWNEHVSSPREAFLEYGRIGTSNIAHRNIEGITWKNLDGYGHDWFFISQLLSKFPNPLKIAGTSYTVCHIPNVADV